jgi:circadian clock protein KaiC
MKKIAKKSIADKFYLPKAPSGIEGLDEILEGGLPQGRPSLICGSAGCGKTLMAMEFLIRGIEQLHEPGVFMAFEETAEDLTLNVASLGFDLPTLVKEKKLKLDYVHIDRSEIEETGLYDLEGLFIRLGYAIDSIGAKRVVLDTIETLFSGLSNEAILRSELKRLFRWLKDKGVTAIITAERGEGSLTRQGLEEYVSDCVILLDNRVINQVTTRRLRVVKYRGSIHGTNEYPFLIDKEGISVLPVTSLKLEHEISNEIVSTGIPELDAMFGKPGFYRASSVLLTGTAGTAKTTFAASFARQVCSRKELCLFFAFEESPKQLIRNMQSVGIDLQPYVDQGLLQIHASRPTVQGLEMHLVAIHKLIKEVKPSTVIVDPISNLITIGQIEEVRSMLTRLIDFLKVSGVTALFTALTVPRGNSLELTEEGVSSLVDTWIMLRDIEGVGERNRGLSILKSRGMSHSNQIREFFITERGIELLEVYIGPTGIVTGSARQAYELQERSQSLALQNELARKDRELERKRRVLEATINNLRTEFESVEEELKRMNIEEKKHSEVKAQGSNKISRDEPAKGAGKNKQKKK